jgi:hypothetical protein
MVFIEEGVYKTEHKEVAMIRRKSLKAKSKYNIWYIPVISDGSSKYNVIVMTEYDPVTIGRELSIEHCRQIVKQLNTLLKMHSIKGDSWFGDRKTLVKLVKSLYVWRKSTYSNSRR